MPTKFELEQERDDLRAKLQEAHALLGEALGFQDDEDTDDEVSEEDDEDE